MLLEEGVCYDQCVLVPKLCPTLFDPKDYSLLVSSVHVIFQARVLEWVDIPFSRVSIPPDPGVESRSPTLKEDSFLSEPRGKPKNTAVGSLSLLLGIFLTQGLNPGPLHCRQILYCLSLQGSPIQGDE